MVFRVYGTIIGNEKKFIKREFVPFLFVGVLYDLFQRELTSLEFYNFENFQPLNQVQWKTTLITNYLPERMWWISSNVRVKLSGEWKCQESYQESNYPKDAFVTSKRILIRLLIRENSSKLLVNINHEILAYRASNVNWCLTYQFVGYIPWPNTLKISICDL